MKGITIAWREEPFRCEFRSQPGGSWLHLLRGDELVACEAVASVTAAYERAREISRTLQWKERMGA